MEQSLSLYDNIGLPDRHQRRIVGLTWCIIYITLILIAASIVIALIPLYITNHSVDVPKSYDTVSDLWKLRFYTNYHYVGTRITIQIDKRGLSNSVDQSFGFKIGTVVTEKCEFIQGTFTDVNDRRRRRQDTAQIGVNGTDFLYLQFRLEYPRYCFNNAICKRLFRQRCRDKIKESDTYDLEVPLIDGQILRFKGRLYSLTEYYNESVEATTIGNTASTTTISSSLNTTTINTANSTVVSANNSTTSTSVFPFAEATTTTDTSITNTTTISATATTTTGNEVTTTTTANVVTTTTTANVVTTTTTANAAATTNIPTYLISINRPTFCATAAWNSMATTFADSTTVGSQPNGIFVNRKNTVYAANKATGQVLSWLDGSSTATTAISSGLSSPFSLFVTVNDNIYVDNGETNKRVDKFLSNEGSGARQMYVCQSCYGLFIDGLNNLYCSLNTANRVVSKSLDQISDTWYIVAGPGVGITDANTLNQPRGIFVDTALNLYVADSGNNRIQKFSSGQLTGTEVPLTGLTSPATLSQPSGVVLDGDNYLFIVDSGNNRIVRETSTGFVCAAGCTGGTGSGLDQLASPRTMAFDSNGNILVTDETNNRIQKFSLTSNPCVTTITDTLPTATTTPAPSSNAVSFNIRSFAASPGWDSTSITFTSLSPDTSSPYGLFIDLNNDVYVTDKQSGNVYVYVWATQALKSVSITSTNPYGIFATTNGDIYVDNGGVNGRVDKYNSAGTTISANIPVLGSCNGLFIDKNNIIYCSMSTNHQVLMKSLDSTSSIYTFAAGIGCSGSTSYQLNGPQGIFVKDDLTLYVADTGNNRIQKFLSGQLDGETITLTGVTSPVTLTEPTGVVLDTNGYLFIVDSGNHRIIQQTSTGFGCVAACSGVSGSDSTHLSAPQSIAFDSHGNIFVTDRDNHRVVYFPFLA